MMRRELEGGMESALWAGKRLADKPARIKLSAALGAEQRGGQTQGELRYDGGAGGCDQNLATIGPR